MNFDEFRQTKVWGSLESVVTSFSSGPDLYKTRQSSEKVKYIDIGDFLGAKDLNSKIANGDVIDGFTIEHTIAETDFSSVYQVRDSENHVYCLKVLKSSVQDAEAILSFRKEAALLAKISHDNVVGVHRVGKFGDQDYMCMEKVNGVPIDKFFENNSDNLLHKIEAMIQVCEGLEQLHNQEIIHLDLKPDNILVESNPGQEGFNAKIIDLGLSQDSVGASESSGFIGTMGYCPPEQSGLVNWQLGTFSDLYSVGVVAYELFANQALFPGVESHSLIESVLTKVPEPLCKLGVGVPQVLSDILARLLEKKPEDRYDSTLSLKKDFELVLKALRSGDINPKFELDAQVKSDFKIGRAFVGREKELELLKTSLKHAQKGKFQCVFVSGEAGSGKSSLLGEFENRALLSGAKFAYGKCYDFAKALPCYSLGEAFDDFLKKIIHFPEASKEAIFSKIRKNISGLEPELHQIAPGFAEALGVSEETRKYGGEAESRKKVFDLIYSLMTAISTKGSTLVIQLDDLQWGDSVVIEAIENLLKREQDCPVLLICTYRSEEVEEGHPFFKTLNLSEKIESCQRLHVNLFSEDETHELLGAHLSVESKEVPEPMSKSVFDRTKGNPLFITEMIRTFVLEKIIYKEDDQVCFDQKQASQASLPTTVVEMVLRRLEDMSDDGKQILGIVSVLGLNFEFEKAVALSGLPAETVHQIFQNAIKKQVFKKRSDGSYAFFHDRVHEACLNVVPEETRIQVHHKYIEYVETHQSPENFVFELAEHAFRAKDAERTIKYSLVAGTEAKKRHAAESALDYFQRVKESLQSDCEKSLVAQVHSEIAETLVLLGKYDKARENFSVAMTSGAFKTLEKVSMKAKIAECLQREGKYEESQSVLNECLKTLGSPLAKSNYLRAIVIDFVFYLFWAGVSRFFPGKKEELSRDTVMCDVLRKLWMVQVIHDMKPLAHISYRLLRVASKMGVSTELAVAHQYVSFALINVKGPNRKFAFFHIHRSIDVANACDAQEVVAGSLVRLAAYNTWLGKSKDSLLYAERAKEVLFSLGNMWDVGNAIIFLYFSTKNLGDFQEALGHANALVHLGEKTGSNGLVTSGSTKVGEVLSVQGKFTEAKECLAKAEDIATENSLKFDLFQVKKAQGWLAIYSGRDRLALEHFQEAIAIIENKGTKFFEAYISECYLGWMEAVLGDSNTYQRYFAKDGEVHKRIEKYIEQCENREKYFGNFSYVTKIKGLWQARRGEISEAEVLYKKAIEEFLSQGKKMEAARVQALSAELLMAQETQQDEGVQALLVTYKKLKKMGAEGITSKMKNVLAEFGHVDDQADGKEDFTRQTLDALLQVSEAASDSIDPTEQAIAILDKTIEIFSAERAFLFLVNKNHTHFFLGRDQDKKSLDEAEKYSRTLVKKIADTQEAFVVAGTEEGVLLGAHSAVANNLLSMVGAPILYKGELMGVLYLDNRVSRAVYSSDHAKILMVISGQIATSLNMSLLAEKEIEYKESQRELEVSSVVQNFLLPENPDIDTKNYGMASFYQPLHYSGGDWWWYETPNEDYLRLAVGDISGHNVGSAMVMAMLGSTTHLFRKDHEFDNSGQYLTLLNRTLHQLCNSKYCATMSIVEYDAKKQKVNVWFRGAPPVIKESAEGEYTQYGAMSTLLGLSDSESPDDNKVVEFDVIPGDTIYVFTDGIIDIERSEGRTLGLNGLIRMLRKTKKGSAQDIRDGMVQSLERYFDGVSVNDDVTYVVLKIK